MKRLRARGSWRPASRTKLAQRGFADKLGNYSQETVTDIVQINEFLSEYKDSAKVLSLDETPRDLQKRFFMARSKYKTEEESSVKEFFGLMERWKKRSQAAVDALPPRLKFQAMCQMEQLWDSPKATDYPPPYNPRNLLSAPPHVRSTLEFNWKPGDDISMMVDDGLLLGGSTKKRNDFLLDEDISEMGNRAREKKEEVSKEEKREAKIVMGMKKESREETNREKHALEMRQKQTKMMVDQWKKKFNNKTESRATEAHYAAKRDADEITPDNLPTMDELLKDRGKNERFFALLPDLLQQMDPKRRADFVEGLRLLYSKTGPKKT